ncbi:MAG TPA: NAD(P)-dependent oxidoreductase, partial [Gemmatales bacterium]|nr:NAD(P)-dependent oxidoreductase [Gemmatales bacterium]
MSFAVATPGKTRIGWIGTGVMGRWMCQHAMAKGFQATVFNRTRAKAEPLLEQGAKFAATPREVAEQADIIFAIVGFPQDVEEVFLGEDGALEGCRPGKILVDMTTSSPSLAREIARAAAAQGVASLDAPVSGGDIGAREARLSIMVGGDAEALEAVKPVFATMGKTIVLQGGPGAGQHTKMVN